MGKVIIDGYVLDDTDPKAKAYLANKNKKQTNSNDLKQQRPSGPNVQTLHNGSTATYRSSSNNSNNSNSQSQSQQRAAPPQGNGPMFEMVPNETNPMKLPDLRLFGTLLKPQYYILAIALVYFMGTVFV